ncbi:hypothetical protein DUI87_04519 [Hirundo rustica rustica]|uniref:Receptor-type tyrosine-protein phosphatase-like N n=1 Tax=Hirundo rustica rustica TaxID=333673 RepID=A0A3M0L419_HIRRU|nr:hypothetical protein DUI87_04519 [Hirundo rustica rustica]
MESEWADVPCCLFDRRLCSPQEVCVQDGLFGQCQVGSVQDRPYFQVTSPVLQRLQDVLRHLMAQGLSWQDGITQYVISQEMERIPRLRLPPSLEPAARDRFLPLRSEPRRAPLAPDPGLPAAQHLELPPPLLLSPLVQRYLEHVLLPSPPQLGYEEALLNPYSYHKVMEGDMQHGEEPVPPFSTVPSPKIPVSSSPGDGTKGRAASSPAPQAEPQQGHGGDALSPRKHIVVEKKSYTEMKQSGAQQGMRPLDEYGYIVTDQKPLGLAAGVQLLELLAKHLHLSTASFINISVVGPALTFRIRQNPQNFSLADVASQTEQVKGELEHELGLKIVQTGVGERNEAAAYSRPSRFGDGFHSVLLTFIALACVAVIAIAVSAAFCLRRHAKQREKERLAALGPEGAADTTLEYQELCRQHMAAKSLFGRTEAPAAPAETSRVSSVSSQFSDAPQPSPSSHSSTPSWCEEPVQSNMDISTGHMILAYMEDHLRNQDRLAKEWQALCAYQAEPSICSVAQSEANLKKNRNSDYVPYDHVRIKLKAESNPSRSDFINASPIIDHDPRMPAYIATQGPLSHTIADFWQVNLVSEHIWCEDFLVRSFYLKNVQSQETRTLTQFHFLSWPAEGIPTTTRPLLDFRRKVNKCYRGRSCPIIVHCSDGAGRTGTYILVDMVLNRMAKGVKEIDIAATLEHIRDQRPGMVQTKDQFEFALTAVAEEVNAILKALPQ